jgi:hypothetical protein
VCAIPTEEERVNVMVIVQKDQWAFAQYNKERIAPLEQLTQVEVEHPSHRLGGIAVLAADITYGIKEADLEHMLDTTWNQRNEGNDGEQSHRHIPHLP